MTAEQLIGAVMAEPQLARPLLRRLPTTLPESLRPILASIQSLISAGVDPGLLAVTKNLSDLQTKELATALVVETDLQQARALAASASVMFTDISEELLHPVEPSWAIDELLEDCTTAALIGESGACKSFVAVTLSYCFATGFQFAGHKVKRTGLVFYFAPEGRHGFPRRFLSCQEHYGITIPKGRIFLPKGRIEFNLDGARRVAEAMADLVDKHGPPALVVIDTLARSLPAGADENSSRDMMEFVNAVELLRDRFNCVVLIVHHSGHAADAQGRARGSSAFRAALDTEILVDRRKKQLRWTKMKDAETPPPIPFELVPVGASAVAVYGDPQEATGPELTKAERFAINTLQETLDRLGRHWATVDEWRIDFYRRHHADDPNTKRRAFNRSRADLIEKGALILDSDAYALTGQTRQNGTSLAVSHGVVGPGQTGHTSLDVSRLSRHPDTVPPFADVDLIGLEDMP